MVRGAGTYSHALDGKVTPQDADRATPPDRDRYVDLIRAVSILSVVVGHWLVTQFTWEDGSVELHSALGAAPGMWPITWVLQVMPLFFFVGGFSNRRSWLSTCRRGEGYAAFVDRRVHRLLAPTAVFLVAVTCWSAVEAIAGADVLGAGGRIMLQPVWFLGVYIGVIALTPVTSAWHDRWGGRVIVALAGLVAVVEVVRLGIGRGSVAYLNVLLVWVMVHQLGYLYGDGWFTRRRAAVLAVTGVVAVSLLVALGPYPARMVGVPGDRLVNMNPPTAALAALALAQVGVAVLLRDVVGPWLRRPALWSAVVVVNLSIMSIYLWHQPALAVLARVGLPRGLPQPTAGSVSWWLTRPVWIALAATLLVTAVLLVARFEHVRPVPAAPSTRRTGVTAAVAVTLLAPGLLALAGTDATELLTLHRVLRFLDVAPVLGLGCVAVAYLLLRGVRRGDTAVRSAAITGAACFLLLAGSYATGAGPFATSFRAAAIEVLFAAIALVPILVAREPSVRSGLSARRGASRRWPG